MKRLFAIFALVALCAAIPGCDKGPKEDTPQPESPERLISLRVSDIRTNVDADRPEAIEVDLAESTLWAVGGGVDIALDKGPQYDESHLFDCTFVGANNTDIASGTMSMEDASAEIHSAYTFLPIGNQILYSRKWVLKRDNEDGHEYDVFVVRDKFTRMNITPVSHFRLYENLTEHYKTKFPDAGVKSVVRVLISPGSM